MFADISVFFFLFFFFFPPGFFFIPKPTGIHSHSSNATDDIFVLAHTREFWCLWSDCRDWLSWGLHIMKGFFLCIFTGKGWDGSCSEGKAYIYRVNYLFG